MAPGSYHWLHFCQRRTPCGSTLLGLSFWGEGKRTMATPSCRASADVLSHQIHFQNTAPRPSELSLGSRWTYRRCDGSLHQVQRYPFAPLHLIECRVLEGEQWATSLDLACKQHAYKWEDAEACLCKGHAWRSIIWGGLPICPSLPITCATSIGYEVHWSTEERKRGMRWS